MLNNDHFNLRKRSIILSYGYAKETTNATIDKFLFKSLSMIWGESYTRQLIEKYCFRQSFPIFQNKIISLLTVKELSNYPDSKILEELNNLKIKKSEIQVKKIYILKAIGILFHDLYTILNLIFLPTSKISKLAVEIGEGVESIYKRSELNWDFQNTFDKKRMVLIHENPKGDRLIEDVQALANLVKEGASLISDNPKLKNSPGVTLIHFPLSNNASIPFRSPLYILHVLSWLLTYIYWRIFFKKQNIKSWLFVNEERLTNIIQRIAIEKNSGIAITRHRSNLGEAWGVSYQPGHICMLWNKEGLKHFNSRHNRIECGIVAGHPFVNQSLFVNWKKCALEMRTSFKAEKPFVIGFFDNAFGPNMEISTHCSEIIYSELFAFLNNNKNVFLILKSKREPHFPSEEIKKLFFNFVKEDKARSISGTFIPSIIALASDIVIGYGSSSPMAESIILKRKSILLWPAPDSNYPLYNQDKVLLQNPMQLGAVLQDVYVNGENSIWGKCSDDIIEKFDSFADGEGPKRLKEVLEASLNYPWKTRKDFYSHLKNNNMWTLQ